MTCRANAIRQRRRFEDLRGAIYVRVVLEHHRRQLKVWAHFFSRAARLVRARRSAATGQVAASDAVAVGGRGSGACAGSAPADVPSVHSEANHHRERY